MAESTRQRAHPQGTNARNRRVGTPALAVVRATGLARTTVARGMADVRAGETVGRGRIRREGAGRPTHRAARPDPAA